MRTPLNIEDDVLATVKALAARDRKPLGAVVSAMLRAAVEPPPRPARATRNGIPLFPVSPGARLVTPEQVRELLEEKETGERNGPASRGIRTRWALVTAFGKC